MTIKELMRLEPVGGDRFAVPPAKGDFRRTFGGLLASRVIAAAATTVEDRPCHALHLLFTRPGDPAQPMELAVERLRDGRSFAARQVRVSQGGRELVTALASFHGGDPGPNHAITVPPFFDPDAAEDQLDVRRRNAAARGERFNAYLVEQVLDIRARDWPENEWPGGEPHRSFWFRARQPLGDDPLKHQFAIAFASDIGLVHVGILAHREDKLDAASLDHTIWFHRPASADDWLLCTQRSTIVGNGRGLSHATISNRNGHLVASVAQEILIRQVSE